MAREKRNSNFLVILLLAVLSSCNVVKYLKPGEQLYTGAELKLVSQENLELKKTRKKLENILTPKPNQTIFGIRFKLWFYYVAGENPKKGFKKMLKYKLGEKPVLYDPGIPEQVSGVLVNRLENMGYFDARVDHETKSDGKKASVSYTAHVTRPYTIAEIHFPEPETDLTTAIFALRHKSLIKPGMRYDLDLLKNERSRIDQELKERGYYFFNADQLLFKADTTIGAKNVRIRLQVKKDAPLKTRVPFILNDIYIHASNRAGDSTGRRKKDTIDVDGYHYIRTSDNIRPSVVTRSILLRKGDPYSRRAHSSSVTRLMSMGMFHYVNVRFMDTLLRDSGKLDAHIFLTPMKKRSIQLELQAVTKSNNYTGPSIAINYKNRNLFKGAELLQMNLYTSYETQFTGAQKGFNSYEVGGEVQLYLPRFIVPFNLENVSTRYTPKTKMEVGFRNLNRVHYFKMNAINISYGYQWKETAQKEHLLNPFAVNFAKVLESSEEFDAMLATNPYLKRSFEQQFTIGGNYAFTYNGIVNNLRPDQFFFTGMVDLSGNLLNLAQQAINDRKPSISQPFTLLNYSYDMYSRFTADGRYYHEFNKNSKIATRVLGAVGIPYGNSSSLPYIKQFFSGGANSIRAFLPRTVGPGTYSTVETAEKSGFLDQAGDIKLEGNVEYRFTMISVLKGALFVDAGNIWLFRENEQQRGGKFDPKTFYRQFAVGTGFGLRIDITYFALRFDLGMPLRIPYVQTNRGWVINEIDFSSYEWRRKNLVLNIAIGYPF